MLHLAIVGSPHPHARVISVDSDAASALAGVHAILTHADAPAVLFSTGRHQDRTDDPDDSRVIDSVMRFRGQRVAAVVADSIAIAEAACRLIVVDYEVLPANFDPERATASGTPLVHADLTSESGVADPGSNLVAELHGEFGSVADGLASAAAVVHGSFHTQRVSHVALETHATRGWVDETGRFVLRTSSQVPYLVRDELCHIFDLDPARLRVFTARVGGGFGGKQELLTEDIVLLAVLATGRPVQYEFTRTDEFMIGPMRHPMRIDVTLGADSSGLLTAIAVDMLADTGAYGNHGPGVMFHSCNESLSIYRCANKRVDTKSVYTNNLPSGAFRGYGLGQIIFAVESAMDDLARELGIDRLDFRRRNVIVPGDPMVVTGTEDHSDLLYGSYGLDQCIDLVERALERGNAVSAPDGPTWRIGTGAAVSMIATLPPRGHFAEVTVEVDEQGCYTVGVGTAEFGNGTTTAHVQLLASAMNTTVERITIRQSDTDLVPYDTGAFGSAGTVVAGAAILVAAASLRSRLEGAALALRPMTPAGSTAVDDAPLVGETKSPGLQPNQPPQPPQPLQPLQPRASVGPIVELEASGVRVDGLLVGFADLLATDNSPWICTGSDDGSPRSVAFNVHGFRVAVDTATGEVRILQSIQAADAGVVINPEQLRGQVEGGTAQAIGTALYEEVRLDGEGRVINPEIRNYHVPQFADIPPTEVYFADTVDTVGPRGAKSMSEAPYNPVAPALANAVTDALGVRPRQLPMSRDRLWRLLRT